MGSIVRLIIGVPIAIGSLILRRKLGVPVPEKVFDACSRDVSRLAYRLEMRGLLKLSRQRSVIDRLFAEYAERDRMTGHDPVTRSWNTSWIFRPSLATPLANWIAFQNGRASISLPASQPDKVGRARVLMSGPGHVLANRSFDLLLNGIWIGRARFRMTRFLGILPHRSWRADITYRLPLKRPADSSGQLEIVALDHKKMPSATELPGVRAVATAVD